MSAERRPPDKSQIRAAKAAPQEIIVQEVANGDFKIRDEKGRPVTAGYLAKMSAGGIMLISPEGDGIVRFRAIYPKNVRATGGTKALKKHPEPKPLTDDEEWEALRISPQEEEALIVASGDMLGVEAFAQRLGTSNRQTVHDKRHRREVIGFQKGTRTFYFPSGQLDEKGRPFPEIRSLFALVGDDPWSVHRFLSQKHDALGGIDGYEALARGRGPEIVSLATAVARGDFV